jgi:HTH-type transcriptional regulator, competence development regulator
MSFGTLIRQERLARGFPLRQMAKTIGISPTYLSKIEREQFPPPAEDKVKDIAALFGWDPDELLAQADRVASDLIEIIKRAPIETAAFLRAAQGLPVEQIAQFAQEAKRASKLRRGGAG